MLLEDRKFHPTKLNLAPLLRWTRSDFDKIFVSENQNASALAGRSLRVPRLAVLIEHRLVTNKGTDHVLNC